VQSASVFVSHTFINENRRNLRGNVGLKRKLRIGRSKDTGGGENSSPKGEKSRRLVVWFVKRNRLDRLRSCRCICKVLAIALEQEALFREVDGVSSNGREVAISATFCNIDQPGYRRCRTRLDAIDPLDVVLSSIAERCRSCVTASIHVDLTGLTSRAGSLLGQYMADPWSA